VVSVIVWVPSHIWPCDHAVLLRRESGTTRVDLEVGAYLQEGLKMANVSDSQSVEKQDGLLNTTVSFFVNISVLTVCSEAFRTI